MRRLRPSGGVRRGRWRWVRGDHAGLWLARTPIPCAITTDPPAQHPCTVPCVTRTTCAPLAGGTGRRQRARGDHAGLWLPRTPTPCAITTDHLRGTRAALSSVTRTACAPLVRARGVGAAYCDGSPCAGRPP